MKRIIYFLALIALLMQSCSIMKDVHRPYDVPGYNLTLTSVELPANAKEQYGETITTDKSNGDSLRYTFEDNYLRITWYATDDRFYFTLYNKSDHSLKIIWDDAALVMPNTNTLKLMHSGIKFDRRNETQVPTTIPRGAKINDILIPTENVKFNDHSGWQVDPLLPQNITMEEAETLKGKVIKILLPIKIEDIQNEYTFIFNIDTFPKEEYYTEKVHDIPNEIVLNVFTFGVIPAFIVFLLTKLNK